jgi:hypothetical protein
MADASIQFPARPVQRTAGSPRAFCRWRPGARSACKLGLAAALLLVASRPAWCGSSLRFYGNGRDDVDRVKVRIDAPERPADVGGDFTLEWWMKALPGQNAAQGCAPAADGWITGNILYDRDVYGAGDRGDWGVALFREGLAFGVARGNEAAGLCGARDLADGRWHHVAVTRRASTGRMQLYVDGRLDGAAFGPTGDIGYRDGRPTMYPGSDPFLVLGAEKHDAGQAYPSYSGWLDEIRLSGVVRYTGPYTPPAAPYVTDAQTVALYHLDEGSGNAVNDASGAPGGPSSGVRRFGGTPPGPVWSADEPWDALPTPTAMPTPAALPAPAAPAGAGLLLCVLLGLASARRSMTRLALRGSAGRCPI